jgi:hypothetical protein
LPVGVEVVPEPDALALKRAPDVRNGAVERERILAAPDPFPGIGWRDFDRVRHREVSFSGGALADVRKSPG